MKHPGDAETDEERAAEAAIARAGLWPGSGTGYAPLTPDVASPVHRGVESAVWRVVPENGPPAVLKIMRPDMRPFFDPAAAVAGARLGAETGAGPKVLWSDPEAGALAMEALEPEDGWRTAGLYDLQDRDVMQRVLGALRLLHEGAPLEAEFDVFAEIEGLHAVALAAEVETPPDLWRLMDETREMARAFAAAGRDRAPCRNDGVASDIMLGPGGAVRLIDYDRAGMNDPLHDLAALMTEAHPFESEMAATVEMWCGRADPRILSRCLLLGAADDLMWALWGAVAAAQSPRTHVEFRKYCEWRFLRCRMTLGDARHEERLRRI